jgi:hypothetical protein
MTIRSGIRVAGQFVWVLVVGVLLPQAICAGAETGIPALCLRLQLLNAPCVPCGNPCCCPDDYRPKCLPVEPCRVSGCRKPCYCGKWLPCVPPAVSQGCCDDYCAKPFSLRCLPLCEQWFTCGPPEVCHGGTPVRAATKAGSPNR